MRRLFLAAMLGSMLVGVAPAAQAEETPVTAPASSYFVLRLIPPRASFMQDMTQAEAQVMQEHVAYWTAAANEGRVVIFGPVLDPKGLFGLGILRVQNEADVSNFTTKDPAIVRGIGMKYEIAPMAQAVLGKGQ